MKLRIKGDLSAKEDLTIDGSFEGAIDLPGHHLIIAAGSDAPVLTRDPQPLVNMEIGVTRSRRGLPPLSPWQRLNIRDLIDAYTIKGLDTANRAVVERLLQCRVDQITTDDPQGLAERFG